MKSAAKALAIAFCAVSAAITLLLLKLTIERARLPYENGRHFDPRNSVVYDEGAVMVYGLLGLASAIVTAIAVVIAARVWRR